MRELEDNGIVSRTVYPVVPPKVEYALTDEGKKLIPVLDMLCNWSTTYAGAHGISCGFPTCSGKVSWRHSSDALCSKHKTSNFLSTRQKILNIWYIGASFCTGKVLFGYKHLFSTGTYQQDNLFLVATLRRCFHRPKAYEKLLLTPDFQSGAPRKAA